MGSHANLRLGLITVPGRTAYEWPTDHTSWHRKTMRAVITAALENGEEVEEEMVSLKGVELSLPLKGYSDKHCASGCFEHAFQVD